MKPVAASGGVEALTHHLHPHADASSQYLQWFYPNISKGANQRLIHHIVLKPLMHTCQMGVHKEALTGHLQVIHHLPTRQNHAESSGEM